MQTDFNMYSRPFIVGQRADCSLNQIDSFTAEADIKFGSAVKRGTNKDKQALPSDGKEFLGIALRDDLATSGLYKPKTMVSVMTKGRVAVIAAEAVVAGDKAYLQTDGTFNKTKGEKGLEIGTFVSTQESENNIAILEI
jgi:hypothetical protein